MSDVAQRPPSTTVRCRHAVRSFGRPVGHPARGAGRDRAALAGGTDSSTGRFGTARSGVAKLDDYDWVVFSSAHAVAAVTQALDDPPSKTRVAVVGESTAEALRLEGWPVHLTAHQFGADGLVTTFSARELVRNKRVLYPAGSLARSQFRTVSIGSVRG